MPVLVNFAVINQTQNGNTVTASQIAYIHSGHLNTPRIATNSTGQTIWQWQSTAFGEDAANDDVDGDGTLLTLNLRFPGQYYDQESGLNYNYFRDYDPSTGRYVQSDLIGLAGGLNTFGYALSNPLFYSDPNGLFGLPLIPIIEAIIQVMDIGAAVACSVAGMAGDAWDEDVHETANHNGKENKTAFDTMVYNCELMSDICERGKCLDEAFEWYRKVTKENQDFVDGNSNPYRDANKRSTGVCSQLPSRKRRR